MSLSEREQPVPAGPIECSAAAVAAVIGARKSEKFRSAAARVRRMGWRDWVEEVADCLRDTHRAPDLASSLRACGRLCWVTDCETCEERAARVEIRASCDVRVCPFCARRKSHERVDAVGAAIERLPDHLDSMRAQAAADTRQREADAIAARDHWRAVAAAALSRRASRVAYWCARASSPKASESTRARAREQASKAERDETRKARRAERLAAGAEHRRKIARRELHAIRESSSLRLDGGVRLGAWRWKLVTISPRWNPRDPREVDAAGLRRRVDDAFSRWSKCWAEGAKAGGLAAAYASAECSGGGHVHLHVLYLGPYIDVKWWRDTAGCFVDVRGVDELPTHGYTETPRPAREAVMEAVKYALKSPSPHSRDWISGERRKVAHPRLAAAWVMATRFHQIARAYGSLYDVLGDEEEREKEAQDESAEKLCCYCGEPLTSTPYPRDTADMALQLAAKWNLKGKIKWGKTLPARVVFPRV